MPPVQVRMLQLAILTGRRINEVSGIESSDIRLDQTILCLFIPAQREGNKPNVAEQVFMRPLPSR
jgi:integrase